MTNQQKTKYNRSSLLVKTGRIYQNFSKILYPLDCLLQKAIKEKNFSTVVLLAPPRSGSTLAYQVLTSGISNFHLTNIWNLLYATPVLGGVISNKLSARHQSNFQSSMGFVGGLCGEAEGVKFWSHWIGQGLEENNNFCQKKYTKFYKILGKTKKNQQIFITGYLGHSLCINELKKIFPKLLFVHLKRDLLSNAYSLFKLSEEIWPSVKPKEISNYNNISKHRASIVQLLLIHKKILDQTDKENVVTIDYHDLCENPKKTIKNIIKFSKKMGIEVRPKDNDNIPEKFPESKIKPNLNEDTQKIQKYLEIEINKKEFSEVKKLFSK